MSTDTVEQSILRLFHDIDRNDDIAVSGAFADDGIWIRPSGARVGRRAIAQEMLARPIGRRIEHLVTNILIVQEVGDAVEILFKALAFADPLPLEAAASPMTHPIALDAYRATLIRKGGRWLVSRLEASRRFAS